MPSVPKSLAICFLLDLKIVFTTQQGDVGIHHHAHQFSKRDLWLSAQYLAGLAGIADELIYLGRAVEFGIADHIVSVDHGFVVATSVVLAHMRLKSLLRAQFVIYRVSIVEAQVPESLVSLPMTTTGLSDSWAMI